MGQISPDPYYMSQINDCGNFQASPEIWTKFLRQILRQIEKGKRCLQGFSTSFRNFKAFQEFKISGISRICGYVTWFCGYFTAVISKKSRCRLTSAPAGAE